MNLTISLILSILAAILGLLSVLVVFRISMDFQGAFKRNFILLAIGLLFAFLSTAFLITEDIQNAESGPQHILIDCSLIVSSLIVLVAASKMSKAVKLIPSPYLKTIGQIT